MYEWAKKEVELACKRENPNVKLDENGMPTRVLGVYPQGSLDAYEVTLTDNTKVVCNDEHIWAARTRKQHYNGDMYSEVTLSDMMDYDIVKEGKIYLQSLSSQIPPLFLDLDINNDILDMCAAPGGKTCEIASLTMNQKNIMAVEANKIRADRLKYNLNLQGVSRANVFVKDSKKLDSFFRFDTILLDAPCSGSGTINLINPRDLQSFSLDLVKNSSKTQKELLKKAIEILKLGHTMVYSTCSILKIENEEVVKSVLGPNVVVEPIELDIDKSNLLPSTIDGVITVKPSDKYEGFFIAKLRKIK
jgi:16S rRNA C967 or C1407 C5-methylase (RsmB/RsmF family)